MVYGESNDRPLRILMVSGDSTVAQKDVVDDTSQFRDVLTSLSQYLDEIHVICRSRGVGEEWHDDNIHVYPFLGLNNFLYPYHVLKTGRRILKNNRIGLITSQDVLLCGIPAYLLKKMSGVPLLLELHGDYLDNKQWLAGGLEYRIYNLIGKYLLKKADLIRATSLKIRENLLLWGFNEKEIFYVPHRTDINKFNLNLDSSGLRKELGVEKYKTLLFVGRFAPEKALHVLIKALDKVKQDIPGIKLIMVGDGPEKDSVSKLVMDYDLTDNVLFLGRVSNKNIPLYYNLADVLVLSSIFEGRPKVVQEALACGTPVVSTNLSGVSELVRDDETGFLVEVNDVAGFADAVKKLLLDKDLLDGMSGKCRLAMEQDFTWDKGINYMVKMYTLAAGRGLGCRN